MTAAVVAMKRDPSEDEEVETVEPDDPPPLDPIADPSVDPASSAHPDHFYCRTQNEMEALIKKSEQKVCIPVVHSTLILMHLLVCMTTGNSSRVDLLEVTFLLHL